jgi:pimeloyl-ACP methyl ester carboxylesterase
MSELMQTDTAELKTGDLNPRHGYAPVNGVDMYYEIHGTGEPLLLLHGAFSAIGTSFGQVLPALASTRRVIAVELQGHGHTADIDRPLTFEGLVDDVAALLHHLGIDQADVFGYSMGGGVALALTIRHPELVRKLIYAGGACYSPDGLYPEMLAGIQALTPDNLIGSPFHEEYLRLNPRPDDFPTLVEKVKRMDAAIPSFPPGTIRSITVPTLLVNGDADIVRPEHLVEMFRLFGGGVPRFDGSVSPSQLAILPGADHVTLMHRGNLLAPMVEAFLDAPMPERA